MQMESSEPSPGSQRAGAVLVHWYRSLIVLSLAVFLQILFILVLVLFVITCFPQLLSLHQLLPSAVIGKELTILRNKGSVPQPSAESGKTE